MAEETETPSYTAELKPTMMGSKNNRHKTTKSTEQFSLMITIKEEDLILGLRNLRILFSNPDMGTRTFTNSFTKKASTQISTEIQTQIQNIFQTGQATLGTTDGITDDKLSIASTLSLKPLMLNTTNFPQSNILPTPNSVHFINNQGQHVVNTLSSSFPLNF